MLSEFGDDPDRYTTAKSRKNYAGTSPLTVASGKKRAVLARHVRNRRLYDAVDQWARCALTNSPGARAFYVVPPKSWRTSLCGFLVGGRGVLIVDGADHADGAVPAVMVVEAVTPVKHNCLCLVR